jgi:hypothetical protein
VWQEGDVKEVRQARMHVQTRMGPRTRLTHSAGAHTIADVRWIASGSSGQSSSPVVLVAERDANSEFFISHLMIRCIVKCPS